MGWNVDKAVTHLQSNAKDESTGKCALFVRKAIEAGGVEITGVLSAKDYGPSLVAGGFVKLGASPDGGYKKGDVAVIAGFTGTPHGHMQMYDGTQWISDFKQRDFWPGPGYRKNQPSYAVYRERSLMPVVPGPESSGTWTAVPVPSPKPRP